MRTAADERRGGHLVLESPPGLRASAGFLAAPATTGPRRAIPGPRRRGRFAPLVHRSGSDAGAQCADCAWDSSKRVTLPPQRRGDRIATKTLNQTGAENDQEGW